MSESKNTDYKEDDTVIGENISDENFLDEWKIKRVYELTSQKSLLMLTIMKKQIF
jgi:hypothetical protein